MSVPNQQQPTTSDERADLAAELCGNLGISDEVLVKIQRYAALTAAAELRRLGQDLLSASYEGPDGGPPSEQGWPHFDCEDILGEYVLKRADALAQVKATS